MSSNARGSLLGLATLAIAIPGGSFSAAAQQADITWSSSFLATNLDSTGAPLDDTYSFYLGVFNPPVQDPPWTPDPSNTAEWAQHWITADVALYDPYIDFRFASGYDAEPLVEGVELTGMKGYIWGVNRKMPGEWILITGAAWSWPDYDGFAFPKNWTVATGAAVLGAINQGGVHMQTVPVANSLPPLLRPELWRKLNFTQFERDHLEATVSGWLADPNGNGRSNTVEYALGSNPRSPVAVNQPEIGSLNISGGRFLSLTVDRDPNTDALMSPEASSDLSAWLTDSGEVLIESETPSTLVVRDAKPIGSDTPTRFLRIQVTIPSNP